MNRLLQNLEIAHLNTKRRMAMPMPHMARLQKLQPSESDSSIGSEQNEVVTVTLKIV